MEHREALLVLIEERPIEDQLFICNYLSNKFKKKEEENILLVKHGLIRKFPLPYHHILSVSTNVEKHNWLDVTTADPQIPVCKCYGTLKALAARLPKEQFQQIHQSHLIALAAAKEITRSKAILKDGRQFKISRTFRKEAGTNKRNPE